MVRFDHENQSGNDTTKVTVGLNLRAEVKELRARNLQYVKFLVQIPPMSQTCIIHQNHIFSEISSSKWLVVYGNLKREEMCPLFYRHGLKCISVLKEATK